MSLVLLLLTLACARAALPAAPIVLPKDDSFLLTPVQWWYWTGHLSDGGSKSFGFEFCFFIVEGVVNLVQAAITDVSAQSFSYTESLDVELDIAHMSLNKGFNLTSRSGAMVAKGGNGTDVVQFVVGDSSVELSIQADKPPALHYGGKAHSYAFGGFTYYYSRPSMRVIGTITNEVNGEMTNVQGTAWFDRQWGDLAKAVLQGWQWFAIELSDNTQLMLFDFLADDGEKYGSATFPNGTTTDLTGDDFAVTVLANWTSPHTGCVYPALWNVELKTPVLPSGSLLITPKVADQELKVLDSPTYWEGAAFVAPQESSKLSGGQAYVELNGYCKKF